MGRRRLAMVAVMAAMVPGVLLGQRLAPQPPQCGDTTISPDQNIAACTSLIDSLKKQQSKCRQQAEWDDSTIGPATSGPWSMLPPVPDPTTPDCEGYSSRPLGDVLQTRAAVYVEENQFDKAIEDYDQASLIEPRDAAIFDGRALAYDGEQNFSRASDDFSQALKLDPDDPAALAGRCRDQAIDGKKLTQALADCNTSLGLAPEDPGTLVDRALVYLKLKQFEPAIADENAALGLSPDIADALYGRGLAEQAVGDAADAATDMAAAVKISPEIAAQFKRYRIPSK